MNKSLNPSSIRSKKEITNALLKLMQDHSYSEISVKQIVLETPLERKTFYNNFSSKDDVLDAIISNAIHEYVVALTSSPEGPLSVIFEFCDKNRELLELLHKNNLLYLLLLKLNEVIPELNRSLDMNGNPFANSNGLVNFISQNDKNVKEEMYKNNIDPKFIKKKIRAVSSLG